MKTNGKLLGVALNLLPFVLFFAGMLFFHQTIRSFDSDDSYFSRIQEENSLVDFLRMRYEGWSGRLSVEAAMYVVRGYPIRLWRWLNAGVMTGMVLGLAALVMGERFLLENGGLARRTGWFLCLGIGLINIQVLSASMFWVTGSFNYLWTITAGIVALIPFRRMLVQAFGESPDGNAGDIQPENDGGEAAKVSEGQFGKIWTVLLGITAVGGAIFVGLGNEQAAATLLGLSLAAQIVVFVKRRKIYPLGLLIIVILTGGLAVMGTAPGNSLRYAQEIKTWYPNFYELTFTQHLILRLGWLLDRIINLNRVLFLLIWGLIAWRLGLAAKSRGEKRLAGTAAVVGGLLLAATLNMTLLHPDLQSWIDETFFSFHPLRDFAAALPRLGKNFNFLLFMVPYALWIPLVLATPVLISLCWGEKRLKGLALAVVLCAGLGSLVMASFSPTIYASASRTAAVFSVCLFAIAAVYFHELKERVPGWVMGGVYFAALANLIFQYIEWSKKYFIHW